jgi:hypothetical protein
MAQHGARGLRLVIGKRASNQPFHTTRGFSGQLQLQAISSIRQLIGLSRRRKKSRITRTCPTIFTWAIKSTEHRRQARRTLVCKSPFRLQHRNPRQSSSRRASRPPKVRRLLEPVPPARRSYPKSCATSF